MHDYNFLRRIQYVEFLPAWSVLRSDPCIGPHMEHFVCGTFPYNVVSYADDEIRYMVKDVYHRKRTKELSLDEWIALFEDIFGMKHV